VAGKTGEDPRTSSGRGPKNLKAHMFVYACVPRGILAHASIGPLSRTARSVPAARAAILSAKKETGILVRAAARARNSRAEHDPPFVDVPSTFNFCFALHGPAVGSKN